MSYDKKLYMFQFKLKYISFELLLLSISVNGRTFKLVGNKLVHFSTFKTFWLDIKSKNIIFIMIHTILSWTRQPRVNLT